MSRNFFGVDTTMFFTYLLSYEIPARNCIQGSAGGATLRWLLRRFNTTWFQHYSDSTLSNSKKKFQTRSCRHKALSCRPLGFTIEKDLQAKPVNLPRCAAPWRKVLNPSGVESAKQSPRGSSLLCTLYRPPQYPVKVLNSSSQPCRATMKNGW